MRAQRVVRRTASAATAAGDSAGGHSSRTIAMSEPIFPCASTTDAGVSRMRDPSSGEANETPSSSTARRSASEKTW